MGKIDYSKLMSGGKAITKRIDCSNVYNFISEWDRRSKWEKSNGIKGDHYIVDAVSRIRANSLDTFDVDELQKWSDEHPRITRLDLFKDFMQSEKMRDERGSIVSFANCFRGGDAYPICSFCGKGEDDCKRCQKYWNEEVE